MASSLPTGGDRDDNTPPAPGSRVPGEVAGGEPADDPGERPRDAARFRDEPAAGRLSADEPAGATDPGDAEPGVDVQALIAGLVEPPRPGAPDLSGVPLEELVAELGRRQRTVARLLREKDRLRARLAEIDQEVARLSPAPDAPSGPAPVAVTYRKPISELTLAQAIARVYEIGDEFSPSEAAERLLDAGFSSRAANFRQIVSQTLTREVRFKRMARGVYQRTA